MIKNYKVELNVNRIFGSKNYPKDECNIFIKTKSADIDEVLDQLIKKHEDLKDINFLLKDVESITYSFTKIIVKNTFIKSPDWIKNKNVQLIHKTKTIDKYSITTSLYHKEIKNNPERISKNKPFINNLNWGNSNILPEEQELLK